MTRDPIKEIKWMRLGDLIHNPRNWKTHPQRQKDALVGAVDELGFGDVVKAYVSERVGGVVLLDGHGRKEAMPDLQVRVAIMDYDDAEADLYLATFDSTGHLAETDSEMWSDLMSDTQAASDVLQGVLDEMGERFGVEEEDAVNDIEDVEPQIDKAAELQEVWGVADGDIWQAGPHYVICGDCREPDTWRRLLAKSGHGKVNGVFTSPPYAEQRKKQYGGMPADEYVEWWEAVQENARANLTDDGSFFVNIKPHCKDGERVLYVFDLVLAMKRRWGWRFVDELCWTHSGSPGKVYEHLKNQFEPVYQFSIDKIKIRPKNAGHLSDNVPQGGGPNMSGLQGHSNPLEGVSVARGIAYPGNVISAGKNLQGMGHQAAFPVRLPDFFIRAYSDPGDVWLDPFLGSGTTIVAAHQADGGQRIGLGIEKLPKYVSVCLERFRSLGLEPKILNT